MCSLISCSSLSPAKRGTHLAINGTKFDRSVELKHFFKGNLHTHSQESDGDAPLNTVVEWYKRNGYDFLSMTEHDKLVDTSSHSTSKFITLPGDEITGRSYRVPIHVNAICGKSQLKGIRENRQPGAILQDQINTARADGALTIVNHPNFGWAFGAKILRKVGDFDFLEVTSGHPLVNENGGEKGISHEALWDDYLTHRGSVWGVGVDDSHHYSDFDIATKANPGRAWVQVAAHRLTATEVCSALQRGDFYFSRGPVITRLNVKGPTFTLVVSNWNSSGTVEFLGESGRTLNTTRTMPAVYQINGSEGYVRARITLNGARAWTQPYFIQ